MKNIKSMMFAVLVMATIFISSSGARAVWIIPVFSISTMVSNLTDMVATVEEKVSLVNSIAMQNVIDETIRGLPKSYMLGAGTSGGQPRSGGSYAGNRIGEYKGVEAVLDYLNKSKEKGMGPDMDVASYVVQSYEEMEEVANIQGELITMNALGATWSKNDSLTQVTKEVSGFITDNPNPQAVLGYQGAVKETSQFIAANNASLHDLSDLYLEDLEKMLKTSEQYLVYKTDVYPQDCLSGNGKEDARCEVDRAINGSKADVFGGNNSRLTELKGFAATANSITSVGSNKCRNEATGTAGVSALRLNSEDQPTTASAIKAVDGAVRNSTSCILGVIAAEIEGMAGTSNQSYFHDEIYASIERYNDVAKYSDDPSVNQQNLEELRRIIEDARKFQYDTDKLALIGDVESENGQAINLFFSNYKGSALSPSVVKDVASAYSLGSGSNLGLQGLGTLPQKTSDLPGVRDITTKLDDIFEGRNPNPSPTEVSNLINAYLFENEQFNEFQGKQIVLNGKYVDYCNEEGECDPSKISVARKIIAEEILYNANINNLAEVMTAYPSAEASTTDRLKGVNHMKSNAEGVQDSLLTLYVAKKEFLRSLIANNYLMAGELYKDSAKMAASIVASN
ncbi:MAG: hypothetical protein GY804_05710 [Alphaproteobacteria bacterium]|nr:hypothetical protein [Alphaproteobacteria bacterium]